MTVNTRSTVIVLLLAMLIAPISGFNLKASSPRMQLLSHQCRQAFATASIVAATALIHPFSASALEWNLPNGKVRLPDTVKLDVVTTKNNSKDGMPTTKQLNLRNPTLIGSGGGGAVFSFSDDSTTLIKISWAGSAKSVERECKTLQRLENIESAERCIGQYPYQGDNKDNGRVMIAVEPYVRDAVISIDEIPEKAKQEHAVEQIARTLVQMLAKNVITIDVQPLISKATGDVIFIDMTEAQTLHPPYTSLDTTLMSSFATEMVTLIPESFLPLAKKTVLDEIHGGSTTLSSEAMEVLSSQLDLS